MASSIGKFLPWYALGEAAFGDTENAQRLPLVGGMFGNKAADRQQQAFDSIPGKIDEMDARTLGMRRGQLEQGLKLFDPVDSLLDQMYGAGSSSQVDVDAIFGPRDAAGAAAPPGPTESDEELLERKRQMAAGMPSTARQERPPTAPTSTGGGSPSRGRRSVF